MIRLRRPANRRESGRRLHLWRRAQSRRRHRLQPLRLPRSQSAAAV